MGIVRRPAERAHDDLVSGLLSPRAWPDPQPVEHLETHISHVFLVGEHAYKTKKPLNLGFLDFSTLAQRRRFCDEELRINRRLAPDLYLAVVPITGTAAAPRVEGEGAPIEYAVKMRRFSQEGLLEHVLERGELLPAQLDALAAQVAQFHQSLPPAGPDTAFGSAGGIIAPALQNFDQLAQLLAVANDVALLQRLRQWTEEQSRVLTPLFELRRRAGFVRECHGDLHLANMVLIDGEVRIFDAIEFNPALRWIDLMNEIAFVVMDLAVRGREDLGARFLNTYLETTGDYEGVRVLRYYVVYRALVRAKIAAMRAAQADAGTQALQAMAGKCRLHLELAHRVACAPEPALVILHGLSGSGKTTCSQVMLETIGAVRIRSDVERKRLHGLHASAHSGSAVGGGIYTPAASQDAYAHLLALAAAILSGGFTVLVDATFLRRALREPFRALAARLRVPFRIAHFVARVETLYQRVDWRAAAGADASEAGRVVLEAQLREQEPLGPDEEAVCTRIDTESVDPAALQALARHLVSAAQ